MPSPVKTSFDSAANSPEPPSTAAQTAAQRRDQGVLRETLLAFAVVTSVVSLLYRLRGVGFIERNLAVVAAVLFLYVPAFALWRRGRELEQYGLRAAPLGRGLLAAALSMVVVFPAFAGGYYLYLTRLCARLAYALPAWHCPPVLPVALRLPPEPVMAILSQLLVVALPEEFFFRGYLQGRLREVLPLRPALLLTAALFALGHFLVTFDPAALAVFVPGLPFGLLRHYTGSVLAGALFHAACNLFMETLRRSLG